MCTVFQAIQYTFNKKRNCSIALLRNVPSVDIQAEMVRGLRMVLRMTRATDRFRSPFRIAEK